ncbi:MAG: hypothetical protein K2H96_11185 [Muribaculaceae bacterium]|nr:hypothetical protein [Muribaculaceae bacterium]
MILYVLAIGGSGSRVLKAMTMQFAAGILPSDPVTGNPMKDVTVVPIIIDPHKDNDAVQKANRLLLRYKDIRQSLYGDRPTLDGFFGVKVQTLKDVVASDKINSTYQISDSFIFEMPAIVSSNNFGKFIGIDRTETPEDAKMLAKMLFSKEELETEMSEGFYGSPNIGTIALNVFQESETYSALKNNFKTNDRLFFIGSIFGGTGAAGLPMLVSSIRQDPQATAISNAFMGALIVMPYFSIQAKEDSAIHESDFVIKTKTALKYYIKNLYPYLNCTYYVADEAKTNGFSNDPGKDKQSTNKAHFVEYIGGLAILNFLQQKAKEGDENATVVGGRKEADEHKYMQFEIKEEFPLPLNFTHLGKETNSQVYIPTSSFHFLARFMQGAFESNLSQPFAKGRGIESNAYTDDMNRFFNEYRQWLMEMADHGPSAHNFQPFEFRTGNSDFSGEIAGVKMKKGFMGTKKFEVTDLIKELNSSKAHEKMELPAGKLFMMIKDAMNKILDPKNGYFETKDIL